MVLYWGENQQFIEGYGNYWQKPERYLEKVI